MRKAFAASQGIVASDSLDTVYQREIFFPVDPSTLDYWDSDDYVDVQATSMYLELDIRKYLKYLPELEAEIFWMIYEKRKHQKHIAKLLGLSQPTVSYRYRRVITKLKYLMTLNTLPLRRLMGDLFFLKQHEQEILYDLFFYLNQEMVGQKHGTRQSTVKWIFTKTRKKLEELEPEDPEKWGPHLGVLYFLDHYFAIRVMH